MNARTVDDYLGDGANRFFSSGYRRVRYAFGPVEVSVGGEPGTPVPASVATTVGLTYPIGWSRKAAGVAPRPHLGTIDTILIGVQAAELCLVAVYRAHRRRSVGPARAAKHARAAPGYLVPRRVR